MPSNLCAAPPRIALTRVSERLVREVDEVIRDIEALVA
jgi:hypothetical protein